MGCVPAVNMFSSTKHKHNPYLRRIRFQTFQFGDGWVRVVELCMNDSCVHMVSWVKSISSEHVFIKDQGKKLI